MDRIEPLNDEVTDSLLLKTVTLTLLTIRTSHTLIFGFLGRRRLTFLAAAELLESALHSKKQI